MKKYSKQKVYMLSLILVVLFSLVLFFFPETIKYPYSYSAIQDKKVLVSDGNNNLNSKEKEIEKYASQRESLEKSKLEEKKEALTLKKNIKSSDFKLDIPSLLISLEQKSYDNNIELKIHYDKIAAISAEQGPAQESQPQTEQGQNQETQSGPQNKEGTQSEQGQPQSKEGTQSQTEQNQAENQQTVAGKPVENNSQNTQEQENTEENKASEDPFDSANLQNSALKIDGLNTTIVPITIKGNFSEVRDYIKYLDELGMIEPSTVSIKSTGKKVTAKVVLNVFHGEVL